MYLNLAFFLLVSAFIIAVIKPKSRIQVFLISIITPILFTFIFGTFMATGLEVPRHSLSSYLGGFIGRNAISILISILTLFFCLKRKLNKKEEYKFPKVIFVAIVICAILGGFQHYVSYQSQKVGEQLTEMISKGELNYEGAEEINPVTEKIREEMSEMAKNYDNDLPEEMELGMIMKKCELQGTSIVYTIQWDGMVASDFTDDAMKEMRDAFVEGLKEEQNSPIMKAMLQRMKDYGYDIVYRFINENEEELSLFEISPFEI